ncbi:MAG TPA: ribose-5-phosphate isomerase RpiA [Fibrobacteria bacterium]|nr:ribose-5-phosphate isomerase RpiA [Fibrobacteria bacterium]
MDTLETAKRTAAAAALKLVEDGMALGLGTGSTARHLVQLLAERIQMTGLRVQCCATSRDTADLARSLGIEIFDLDDLGELDLAIDGADEIDPRLNLTKGGGAAHFREKVVEKAAKRFAVIADSTKLVEKLGSTRQIPLEILPFAWKTTCRHIEALGGKVTPRIGADTEIVRTDNGNLIVDGDFGSIADPGALAKKLDTVTGLLEHGLFVGMAEVAFVAHPDGHVQTIKP